MIALLIALLGTCGASVAHSESYPEGFVWGAALSAHQAEGKAGGGENGDWYQFEHSSIDGQSPIAGGDTADVAVDHWNRYAEDFRMASEIGLKSVRISLAWEKIEPEPGVFDESVLSHYRDVLRSMHEQGIQPMIAFHHFTHPVWFHAQGGWNMEGSPRIFLAYATRVLERLGDLCDTWITFNEPMVLVWLGYVDGSYPPNHRSIDEGARVAVNLARAHRLVTSMVHEKQPGRASAKGVRGVGLVNSLQVYEPSRKWHPFEALAAKIIDTISNWAFPSLAIEGEIPAADRALIALAGGPWNLRFPKDEVKGNPQPDWFGVNYYTRYIVRVRFPFSFEFSNHKDPLADNGWGVYPEGLEKIVRETATRVRVPLVVSENGMADATDRLRPGLIRGSLKSLDRLVNGTSDHAPLDLRGYYHWSLTDNFEWLWGYQHRFGLIEIRYDDDLRRVPRESARLYGAEIRVRTAPLSVAR